MKLSQIILLPLAAGIIISIFFLGRIRFTPDSKGNMANQVKPVLNATSGVTVAAGFDHVLKMANSRITKLMKDSINVLSAEVEKTSGKAREKKLKDLSAMWVRTGNYICAGHYLKEAADVNPTAENWRYAAGFLNYVSSGAADSTAQSYAMDEAIICYKNVVTLDSNDIESKVSLALCYIDGKGGMETMNGVLLLKDVEKKDSANEVMNLTLGRLSITSGQFDKAIKRLEKLVKNHPGNAGAYYYLAEAYRATGRKGEAIDVLEKSRPLLKGDPESIKQIEKLINDIKKS